MMTLALLAAGSALAAPAPPAAKVPPKLLRVQLDAARKAYELSMALYRTGKGDTEAVYRWSHRWLTAQQGLSSTKAGRTAAAEAHLGRMRELEKMAKSLLAAGEGAQLDVEAAKFYIAEAEVWLALAEAE